MEIILELLLEIPLQIGAEVLAKFSFIAIGYPLGFLIVMFLTIGSIEPGPIRHCDDGGRFYRSKGMKFWHVTYIDHGKRYMPAETVAIVGWILIGLVGLFSLAILHLIG